VPHRHKHSTFEFRWRGRWHPTSAGVGPVYGTTPTSTLLLVLPRALILTASLLDRDSSGSCTNYLSDPKNVGKTSDGIRPEVDKSSAAIRLLERYNQSGSLGLDRGKENDAVR